MDGAIEIFDLARESVCAVLTLVVVWMVHRHDRISSRRHSEIERAVREILRDQDGRCE
jgi:hypothetical protein